MKKLLYVVFLSSFIISCGQKKSTPTEGTPLTDTVSKNADTLLPPKQEEKDTTAIPVSEMGNGISKFAGAWFDIQFPTAFTVKPSQKSTSSDGYESVFFTSPDQEVEFYIFSPQWSGEPADIAFNAATENKTADVIKKDKGKTLHLFTYEAKDKSYTRSYQESTENDETVKWVVGIKYKSQAAYEKYKNDYLSFKKSLMQYAD